MLRLVKPEAPKQARERRRPPSPSALTPEQQAKARAALRTLRSVYGGWAPLAKEMGVSLATVQNGAWGTYALTGDMLVRICRAGRLSVDAMLETKLTSSERCSACGGIRRTS